MIQPVFLGTICALGILMSVLMTPALSLSHPVAVQNLTQTTRSEFLSISSDEEAITLFMKEFGHSLDVQAMGHRKSKRPLRPDLPANVTQAIPQFMASLIISIRAKHIQTLIQPDGIPALVPLLQKETAQSQWILSKPHSDRLNQLMDLAKAIFELSDKIPAGMRPPSQEFEAYASYFDHEHPQLIGSPTSWISLLEKEGASGVRTRFNEFWDTPQADPSPPEHDAETPLRENKDAYAQHYLNTRLIPVFSSHLIARFIQLQASAEQRARQSWTRFEEWNDLQRHSQAVNRLCGTWQWTVHNHQNHRDHKMTLSFLPPSQQDAAQPQPDTVIVNGNTVYLKWKFSSGFQEDSLLLANRDQRLEGTFVNSLGARGTITGKRLSTCPP